MQHGPWYTVHGRKNEPGAFGEECVVRSEYRRMLHLRRSVPLPPQSMLGRSLFLLVFLNRLLHRRYFSTRSEVNIDRGGGVMEGGTTGLIFLPSTKTHQRLW